MPNDPSKNCNLMVSKATNQIDITLLVSKSLTKILKIIKQDYN